MALADSKKKIKSFIGFLLGRFQKQGKIKNMSHPLFIQLKITLKKSFTSPATFSVCQRSK